MKKPTVNLSQLQPANQLLHVNPHAFDEGFTQSEMDLWGECAEKWYLRYNLNLQKKGSYAWPLIYGTWFHQFCEEFYATKGRRFSVETELPRDLDFRTQEQIDEARKWQAIAHQQFEIYASHWKHDPKIWKPLKDGIEQSVEVEWMGVRLRGKLDLRCEIAGYKGYHLVDNKSTSQISKMIVVGWDFRLQFMFYAWLCWKVYDEAPSGFIVNAMKKPQLRQGEHETLPAFVQRMGIDMRSRPEAYFYRERMPVTVRQLKRFENETLHSKVHKILTFYRGPAELRDIKVAMGRDKNTNTCTKYNKVCEFLPICAKGLEVEKFNYEDRGTKHQELDGTGLEE